MVILLKDKERICSLITTKVTKIWNLLDKGTKVQTFEKSTLLCKFCRFLHRRCSIHAVFTSTCLSIFMSVCKSQSNGFVLANNVSQDGLWILMWLSWLDMALGLKNDRQSDISSWYAIIRCDELYRVQIPWTLVSQYYSWKKSCYLHHWGCRPCHFWPTILSFCPRQGQFESDSNLFSLWAW